jgi:hypothetical protein
LIATTLSGRTAAEAPDIILAILHLIISAAVAGPHRRRFEAVPVFSDSAADISPVRAAVSAAGFGAGLPAAAVLSTDAR